MTLNPQLSTLNLLNPEVFIQLSQDAHKELHRSHLHDALYLIDLLLKEVQLADEIDGFHQLELSYDYLLKFIAGGGKDEECRELKQVMEVQANTYLIKAERAYRMAHQGGEHYVQIAHQLEEEHHDEQSLVRELLETKPQTAQREALLDQLFYAIWTGKAWNEEQMNQMEQGISRMTLTEQCVCLSALTLSLLEYVDNYRLSLLHSYSIHKQSELSTRAFVGVVLVSLVHPDKMKNTDVMISGMIEEQLSTEYFRGLLTHINQSFLICLQAQHAHEKMEKDILPNFMKFAQDGKVEMKMDEEGEIDMDMPIEDSKERQKVLGAMHEFVDMQQDGIDLNAFNMLFLRNMDFFKVLPHWFLPYDEKRTELAALSQNGGDKAVQILNNIHAMSGGGDCAIDQYCSALMIMRHSTKAMNDKLGNLMKQMPEGPDGAPSFMVQAQGADPAQTPEAPAISRQYMKQLYRIFTMWTSAKELNNPFTHSANWLENPILKKGLADYRKGLHYLADYLLKYKNYQEAETYLNQLVKLEGCDAETLRSAALCKQQQGLYAGAINLYVQADILEPDNEWTLNQMQLCYEHLDKHEQRLDCLMQLEKLDTENAKYIADTGLCLMQLGRWQDAAQRFYRLELEGRHIIPSQRAIAWCSLQQGKTEQAMKYYQKVMETTAARWQDFLNAGHAAWVLDDTPKAIELYRGYIKRYLTDDPKITDALTPFNDDNALLLSLGKKQHEIDIMHDILETP